MCTGNEVMKAGLSKNMHLLGEKEPLQYKRSGFSADQLCDLGKSVSLGLR